MTRLKISLKNGNGFEKELPFDGVPAEFLEGFSCAASMLTENKAEYTITIEVNVKSSDQ